MDGGIQCASVRRTRARVGDTALRRRLLAKTDLIRQGGEPWRQTNHSMRTKAVYLCSQERINARDTSSTLQTMGRSSAVWPEATDEDLLATGLEGRLQARLPRLIEEFRTAIESLGFVY